MALRLACKSSPVSTTLCARRKVLPEYLAIFVLPASVGSSSLLHFGVKDFVPPAPIFVIHKKP